MNARPRRRQRGFTLIEVIIAFALLALALTLLLGTLSGAARQVRGADEVGRATLHAQSLLAQLGVGEVLEPGQTEGELEGGRYHWSLQVAPYVDPKLPPAAASSPYTQRLLDVRLVMRWGDAAGQQLQLHSLRLAPPSPVQSAAGP